MARGTVVTTTVGCHGRPLHPTGPWFQVAKNEKVLARPAADPPFRRPFGGRLRRPRRVSVARIERSNSRENRKSTRARRRRWHRKLLPGTRLPHGTLAYTASHVATVAAAATAAAVAARVAATSFAVSRLSPDPPSGEAQPVVEATPPSNNSSHSLLLLVVPRCTPELTASDTVFARARRRRWHRQLLAFKRARNEVGSAANRYADGEIYV